jgi:hypothetical protein
MNTAASTLEQQPDVGWLIQSVDRLVRPIIRMLMGRLPCTVLIEIIRDIYVEEGTKFLAKREGKATSAALVAMSGLDSRAIKSIQGRAGKQYTQSDVCVESAILEMWAQNPLFQDSEGRPAELNLHGPSRTFQGLVWRAAGRAVTPPTVLNGLIDNGNVELKATENRVRLVSKVYTSIEPSEKTSFVAGSFSMHRLANVIAHNLVDRTDRGLPPWLQQDRWSTAIPSDKLPEIRSEIRAVLTRHISEVTDRLEEAETKPPQANQNTVGVGWYYWEQ